MISSLTGDVKIFQQFFWPSPHSMMMMNESKDLRLQVQGGFRFKGGTSSGVTVRRPGLGALIQSTEHKKSDLIENLRDDKNTSTLFMTITKTTMLYNQRTNKDGENKQT